jgi:adenosine/AMP kinase
MQEIRGKPLNSNGTLLSKEASGMALGFELVKIEKPENMNVIIGQSHFIKTVEDLHEAMANAGGGLRFGISFLEASGACLVRATGNDENLISLAKKNALALGTGHAFLIFMENGFPINVLRNITAVPEVCSIFCATANPVQVVVAKSEQGRGIMGVIDGYPPKGVEGPEEIGWRHSFLRNIGYKL